MEQLNKEYNKINRLPFKYMPIMILAFFSINVLSLAMPLMMKKIYGNIIVTQSVDALRFVLGLTLVAMALEAIMRSVKETSTKWIASKYDYLMTNLLTKKLLNVHEKKNDTNYISNLEKFKSISRLSTFYSTVYYQLFIDIPFVLIFLLLIYFYGGLLVLIPIILSTLFIIINLLLSNNYFNVHGEYVKYNDDLMSGLIETLDKIHYIKASGIEETQVTRYKRLLDQVTLAEYESNRYKNLPKVLSSHFSQLNLFMILIAGGYLLTQDAITFGQITACAMLGGRAVSPVVSLMRFYQQTREMKILRGRIDEIMSKKNQYTDQTPLFPEDIYGVVELVDLAYKDTHQDAGKTISMNINYGEMVLISPMNFLSYKEIIRKIAGLEPIESGKVLVDNLDISEWNMNSLKGKVEYLSEHVSIFKGSVLDNITFFKSSEIQSAFEAATLTGLDDLVSKMPEGFESELDSHMLNYLSAGFLQRLNLSRALLERPRIMILDRIDESMDEDTLEMFVWLLGKLKGKTTIIIASQNQQIIEMSDSRFEPVDIKIKEQ